MRTFYLLGVLPFLGYFVGIFFANRVEPYVFGLPFIMFWIAMWVVLTSVIMGIIYKLDPINREGDSE